MRRSSEVDHIHDTHITSHHRMSPSMGVLLHCKGYHHHHHSVSAYTYPSTVVLSAVQTWMTNLHSDTTLQVLTDTVQYSIVVLQQNLMLNRAFSSYLKRLLQLRGFSTINNPIGTSNDNDGVVFVITVL